MTSPAHRLRPEESELPPRGEARKPPPGGHA
jgi:hypothetical protein